MSESMETRNAFLKNNPQKIVLEDLSLLQYSKRVLLWMVVPLLRTAAGLGFLKCGGTCPEVPSSVSPDIRSCAITARIGAMHHAWVIVPVS